MTTILHIATFVQGGAGRAIADLAVAQRGRGHAVVVVASATPEPGYESYPEHLDAIREAGAELVLVDSTFKRDRALNAVAADVIVRHLAGRAPSVVHAHAAVPSRLALALRDRGAWPGATPVVQTMHGWSRGKSSAHTADDLHVLASVDLVVFPSAACAGELLALGGAFRDAVVVPSGLPALPPDAGAIGHQRRSGPPPRRRRVVTIGSLTAQKNHRVLVEALPLLAARHDVEAVLVGEGPQLDALFHRARDLGVADRVRFVGYQRDAARWLDGASLLVQPSLTESFGLAVIEAFRARVPVVASAIPALAELVRPGLTGWLFDPASPTDLAQAAHAVWTQPPAALEARLAQAEALFRSRYTIDRMIAGYEAAYRRASERRGAQRLALAS
ncbi:MAG: glycosyltransferase [Acidobacteriota bacterium]